jgi:TonB family protein
MKLRVQLGTAGPEPPSTERESLKTPLTFSALFHGALFGVLLFGGVLVQTNHGSEWGDEGIGGGTAVPVNLAPSVSLPRLSERTNPVAAETRELNPAEIKRPEVAPPPQPDPRELQLAEKELKRKLAELEKRQTQRELAQLKQQVPEGAIPGTTSSGRASSPMYGMATAQGAGGIGFSGEFGSMYGWYVRAVRECISRHWDRSRVDSAIRAAPRVYVDFEIMRDGIIRNERVGTSSNNPSVDREALRAIQACSGRSEVGAEAKLPPLPKDYAGNSVKVEVWFEFKK